jgi:hypothetical protein
MFSEEQTEIIEEFSSVMLLFAAPGRVATSISGSHGKGKADAHSDFDFRIYAEAFVTENWGQSPGWKPFQSALDKWQARGHRIDGFWPRKISEIDAALDRWSTGTIEPEPLVWSIWGYHLPTDIAAQHAIFDPNGVIVSWHSRLSIYPPALKDAILSKHLEFVRYWRDDYHYINKVERGDTIFLSGLSAKIVHSLCQILFALNETYYPGDGWNGKYIESFSMAPLNFSERVTACLYPQSGQDMLTRQRQQLIELISEVEALLPTPQGG